MKKLLLAALFLALPSAARAITYQSVRASTANVLTPSLQTGAMNLSSGTVQNLNAQRLGVQFGVTAATGTFSGLVTASTFSGSGASLTGVILNQATLQSGATFFVSSGTINAATIGTSWTASPGATLSAGSNRILNVSTPTTSTDAATKGYVDTIASGNTNYIQLTSTLQSGATFFVSSGTVNSLVVSTLSWIANPSSGTFAAERCAPVQQFTVTSSSTTGVHTFIPTHLTGTITPHSTSSYIKVHYNGIVTGNNASSEGTTTILRGGSNILSSGGCTYSNGTNVYPHSCDYKDTPASVATLTYTVGLREQSGGAVTVTFCSTNFTCTLLLQECF